MPTSVRESPAPGIQMRVADSAPEVPRFAIKLPVLLSVIAGMVDLTGFYTLGYIFTAHITGNLVVAAALVVRGGPVQLAQLLAIPVFMLALGVVWSIATTATSSKGRTDKESGLTCNVIRQRPAAATF